VPVTLLWVCAGATLALVIATGLQSRLGVWLTKPVAAAAYVAIALSVGALDSTYGRILLAAFCFSWLGDVLLIPRERLAVFQAGILSFMLAHVLFIVAFFSRGSGAGPFSVALVVAGVFAWMMLRWLLPHVPKDFQIPVVAYVGVVSMMMVASFTGFVVSGSTPMLLGALMFAVSDISVARDRFVKQSFVNEAWGLPLYFAGQVMIALSLL